MFGAYCIAVAMELHRGLSGSEVVIALEKYNAGWTVTQLANFLKG